MQTHFIQPTIQNQPERDSLADFQAPYAHIGPHERSSIAAGSAARKILRISRSRDKGCERYTHRPLGEHNERLGAHQRSPLHIISPIIRRLVSKSIANHIKLAAHLNVQANPKHLNKFLADIIAPTIIFHAAHLQAHIFQAAAMYVQIIIDIFNHTHLCHQYIQYFHHLIQITFQNNHLSFFIVF